MLDHKQHDQSEEAGCQVVQHDAPPAGQRLELADGPWFGDVEEAEEGECKECVRPVGAADNEREPLAGDFIDDDVTRVFAAALLRDESRGRNADR